MSLAGRPSSKRKSGRDEDAVLDPKRKQTEPDIDDAIVCLARVRQRLSPDAAQQLVQALNAYQRAAALDPKLPEVHLAVATILLQMKKFDEALGEIALEQQLVPQSKSAAEIRAKIEAEKSAGP